jgi:hypothetical protein
MLFGGKIREREWEKKENVKEKGEIGKIRGKWGMEINKGNYKQKREKMEETLQ